MGAAVRYDLSPENPNTKQQSSSRKRNGDQHAFIHRKDHLFVGTWNVRTFYAAGKTELLTHEMKRYQCDILGLSEVRWVGSSETEVKSIFFLWTK